MKTRTDIYEHRIQVKLKLEELERQHNELSQIDMLSGEGNYLREKINKLKGEIIGLDWVITK
jgi:predicted nuclease with TOPRIM domain